MPATTKRPWSGNSTAACPNARPGKPLTPDRVTVPLPARTRTARRMTASTDRAWHRHRFPFTPPTSNRSQNPYLTRRSRRSVKEKRRHALTITHKSRSGPVESQRDSDAKPGVARNEPPWVTEPHTPQPHRGCDRLAKGPRLRRAGLGVHRKGWKGAKKTSHSCDAEVNTGRSPSSQGSESGPIAVLFAHSKPLRCFPSGPCLGLSLLYFRLSG